MINFDDKKIIKDLGLESVGNEKKDQLLILFYDILKRKVGQIVEDNFTKDLHKIGNNDRDINAWLKKTISNANFDDIFNAEALALTSEIKRNSKIIDRSLTT